MMVTVSSLCKDVNEVQKNKYYGEEEEIDDEEVQGKSFSFDQLPVGYKFIPTDKELIYYYLKNKVSVKLIPNPIQDIEATDFYSKPPNNLEWNPPIETKDMFFFIHHDDDSYSHWPASTQIVADGIGCWKLNGDPERIYRSRRDGVAYGYKFCYIYFRGKPSVGKELPKLKKTAWVMYEYRLPQYYNHKAHPKMEGKWVLGRIRCGRKAYKNL